MPAATIDVKAVAYHRNGVSEKPYWFVLFHSADCPEDLLAIMPNGAELNNLAIICPAWAAEGRLQMEDGNAWRGHRYEPLIREAIYRYEVERCLAEMRPEAITVIHPRASHMAGLPSNSPLPAWVLERLGAQVGVTLWPGMEVVPNDDACCIPLKYNGGSARIRATRPEPTSLKVVFRKDGTEHWVHPTCVHPDPEQPEANVGGL